jgi:N-acetylneuraminate synthase/N,N'-diacetyllegionaminate synthase
MDTMKAAFQYPVGFSDHTLGIEIPVGAVARGACVLEKHFTLDKNLPGPDHAMSLEPEEFSRMTQAIRSVEAALGTGRKWPVSAEMETKRVVQKAIVAAHDIPKGKLLDAGDLALRRTSRGLPPRCLDLLVGKRLRRAVKANQTISLEMLG